MPLTPEQQQKFDALIEEFECVFARLVYDLGKCDILSHEVKLSESTPINCPPYPVPFSQRALREQHVQQSVQWAKKHMASTANIQQQALPGGPLRPSQLYNNPRLRRPVARPCCNRWKSMSRVLLTPKDCFLKD